MAAPAQGIARAGGEAILLLALGAALAFGTNALREQPVPLRADPRLFALEVDLPVLSAEAAVAGFDAGTHVFLDARDADAFRAGHVGGAFWVPPEAVLERYETLGPIVTGGVDVVLYGAAGDAATVEALAKALRGAGVARLRLLLDGYEGWVAADGPTETGDDPTVDAAGGMPRDPAAAPGAAPAPEEGSEP